MSALSSLGNASSLSNSTATGTGLLGLSTSGISFQGLVSGLNTDAIIQGLLAPDQAVITSLQGQQAQISQQESAYNAIQAALQALQASLAGLTSTTNSVFDGRTVTSSNSSAVSATATNSAVPGQYSLTVNSLAQQQILSSQGFDSAASTITQGTFQFQVGSGAVQTVTINGSNDTLQGLTDAINKLNAGVTATIVNDGSTTQGNHLVLTANQSGTANAVTITNNLAASGSGAMRPELNATYIGAAVTGSGWNGTATPTSNSGSGGYTGSNNDTYTFTVTNGGNVTDAGTTISYKNSDGSITGTLTGNQFAGNQSVAIAKGIQLQFSAGTVTTGQTFTIKAFTPNTQAATNASVTLGSGNGGLTVTSSTNQFQNLFPGVNVTVSGTSATPISLTVGTNAANAATSIDSFVSAYNQLITYINQNDGYDAQSQQAGILLGDTHASSIGSQLAQAITSSVAGVNTKANDLTAIGISVNADGTLAVNNDTLNKALNGQLPNVSANDVRRLFVQDVQSSNPAVSYVYAPTSIQAAGSPIQVQITQAATQGSISGETALAASTTITSSNNTFSLSVDGQNTGTVTLAAGTYTPTQLAQVVQTAINSQLTGSAAVTASVNGSNNLVLTSNSYGSSSKVNITSGGSALSALGYNGGETASGQNVAGSFIYNGVTEAATGNGQFLTSDSSNKYTAGLEIMSTLTAAQITSNPEGTVTVTQGVAAQLNNLLTKLTDPINGELTLANQSLQSETTNIGQEITVQQQSIQKQQQALLAEFTNMETTLAQLQAVGNTLTNSLNAFSPPSSTSSSSSTHG